MDQVGISISPGSMVQIAVSPTLINITQSAFERFDAKERNCYMSHGEIELPHFKLEDDYKYEVIQCNLDLVTLNLVTICDLVTILQRPFFNLLHKFIQFSDNLQFSASFCGDQNCH